MSDSDSARSKHLKVGVNTKKLISMVRERACLWDRAAPEYKNRVLKDRAWHELYCHFEPSYEALSSTEKQRIGNIITKKWCNLRDSYVKSKKPVRLDKRPYVYSDDMKFLDTTLFNDSVTKKRRREDEDRTSNEDEENDSQGLVTWMDEVFVESELTDQSNAPSKRGRLEPEYSKGIGEENLTSFLENLMQREDDEDRAFFTSITPSVKRLSENSKLEFRILVMKLLKSLRTKDRQRVVTKVEPFDDSESE